MFLNSLLGGRDTTQVAQPLVATGIPNQSQVPGPDLNAYANAANLGAQGGQLVDPNLQTAKPVDDFATLWNPTVDKDGNPIPEQVNSLGSNINFNLDVGALDKHFSTIDFTKGLDPNLFSAVASGGDNAIAALPQIINHAVRQAVLTSAQSTTKLVQGTVGNADKNITDIVQAEIKKLGLQDTIRSNPIYSDPAYAPVVDMVQTRVLQKYPNATQADLSKAVDTYFLKLSSAFNPSSGNQPFNINSHNRSQDTGTDWTKYFTS